MAGEEGFDCLSCGACCEVFAVEAYGIDVSNDEELTFQTDAGELLMKTKEGTRSRCIALSGQVGSCVQCTIYDGRPTVCKAFHPGGVQCLDARRMCGLERKEPA